MITSWLADLFAPPLIRLMIRIIKPPSNHGSKSGSVCELRVPWCIRYNNWTAATPLTPIQSDYEAGIAAAPNHASARTDTTQCATCKVTTIGCVSRVRVQAEEKEMIRHRSRELVDRGEHGQRREAVGICRDTPEIHPRYSRDTAVGPYGQLVGPHRRVWDRMGTWWDRMGSWWDRMGTWWERMGTPPWKDAKRYERPCTSAADTTRRSPGATGT